MPESTLTLYCLKCGYNLTANATNSCPECGQKFEPASLQAEITKLTGVTAGRVFLQVFIPAILVAVVWVVGFTVDVWSYYHYKDYLADTIIVLVVLFGIASVIYLIYNNWQFAHRLAYRRMTRPNTAFTPNRLRVFRVACCILLLSGQIILWVFLYAAGAFGVCMIVFNGAIPH